MRTLDWSIVIVVVVSAAWGFRRGAVLGLASLIGLVGGALVGIVIVSRLLETGYSSPYMPLLALIAALITGGLLVELSLFVGYRLRVLFTSGTADRVDAVLGAALLGAFAVGVVWIGAAMIAQSRADREVRRAIRTSVVIREINAVMPPREGILRAIASIDPVPQIAGPPADVAPPGPAIVGDPDVQRAARSTVRVTGSACGYGIEGSGWIGGDGVVVTNAHVVAGERDTTVQLMGVGSQLRAETVWFDPRNDLAILYVPGLSAPPLRLVERSRKGTEVAMIGFPQRGPLRITAARLGATSTVITGDIYDNGPIARRVDPFRAQVRHGNSGGPIVDADGNVRSTVFAARSNSDHSSGFGVPAAQVVEALSRVDLAQPVSTGRCS